MTVKLPIAISTACSPVPSECETLASSVNVILEFSPTFTVICTVDVYSILSQVTSPCNATGSTLTIPSDLNPDVGEEKAEIVVNVGANSSVTLTDSVGATRSFDTGEHTGVEVAIGSTDYPQHACLYIAIAHVQR